jgi:hypothetical protein
MEHEPSITKNNTLDLFAMTIPLQSITLKFAFGIMGLFVRTVTLTRLGRRPPFSAEPMMSI